MSARAKSFGRICTVLEQIPRSGLRSFGMTSCALNTVYRSFPCKPAPGPSLPLGGETRAQPVDFAGGERRLFGLTRRREWPCCRTRTGIHTAWPPTGAFGDSPPARPACCQPGLDLHQSVALPERCAAACGLRDGVLRSSRIYVSTSLSRWERAGVRVANLTSLSNRASAVLWWDTA